MTKIGFDIPEAILLQAQRAWLDAEGSEFGRRIWGEVMAPHRDRIKRVLRNANEKCKERTDPDHLRKIFRDAFEGQLTDLQKDILGRIVEEHADQFSDPWLELDNAADLLANYTSRKRGQQRKSKDRAEISTTGLRAAAKVVDKWRRSEGHGWTYGEYLEPPQLAERILLQVAQSIDPRVTATHVRSVMKNP